ncbi:MAG: lytic murein transglycosylase [Patescibacteria group bacterium]
MKFRVFLGAIAALVPFLIFGQAINPELIGEKRAELELELAQLEAQIEGQRSLIIEKQRESTSLERDIAILDAQIDKARLEIKARNLAIAGLSESISTKSNLLGELTEKLEREKSSLAGLIRRLDEIDQVTLVELLLSYNNLSDFFVDVDDFDTLQKSLQVSFDEILVTKDVTEGERANLEDRKSAELELRGLQELEKKRIEEREAEKKQLLKTTKGKEAEYQKLLAAKEKNAAQIRSQLFLLRGSPNIPFEEAVRLANMAFKITGVRPAFLLGIIAEESNLGANVGTGNWKEDLSHSRCAKQRTAFVQITSELGLDPDQLPVSKRAWYGYCGGAMGPAQFIPTTWLLYKDLVARATGHNLPNPWIPEDAFVASAFLLRDNGAAEGTYTAERRAALKYLAGSNWNKSAYAFYGDDVMSLAAKYQEQINIISR